MKNLSYRVKVSIGTIFIYIVVVWLFFSVGVVAQSPEAMSTRQLFVMGKEA